MDRRAFRKQLTVHFQVGAKLMDCKVLYRCVPTEQQESEVTGWVRILKGKNNLTTQKRKLVSRKLIILSVKRQTLIHETI
jgi:hypothetical protein